MVLALLLRSTIESWLLFALNVGVPKTVAGGAVPIQAKPGLGSLSETKDPVAALPVSCQLMVCAFGL